VVTVPPDHASPRYQERLGVPSSWWPAAPGLGVVVVIALVVTNLPLPVVVGCALVVAVLVGWLLYRYGARINVSDDGLAAGRAVLPWWACGEIEVLDAHQARTAFGAGADARAYLLLRSYCGGAIRVEVEDASDPTPYWLISTRRPSTLAQACLDAQRSAAR
jgi:hypothetical protein